MNNFVIDCSNIRKKYPGLCAVDFQNVLDMVLTELIGYKSPTKNKGIFGEVEAYCAAIEEQGRKTLHTHILIWLKKWSNIMDAISDPNRKQEVEDIFTQYANQITSTKLNAYMEGYGTPKPFDFSQCHECNLGMEVCSDQDLRNLRTKLGQTQFGNKNIIFCRNCNCGLSSEEIAMKNIWQVVTNMGYKTEES